MDGLLNIIKREAERIVKTFHRPDETGVFDSYDKETHSIKLKLQPYDHLTGWIPIGTGLVGDSFGLALGPAKDDQFVIGFRNGDRAVPYVKGRVFSDKQKPPQVESGEISLSNKDKTKVFFDKDNNLTIEHSTGSKTVFDKDGQITHTHKSGSQVQHKTDGSVIVNDKDKATLTLKGGAVTVADKDGATLLLKGGKIFANGEGGSAVALQNGTFSTKLFG